MPGQKRSITRRPNEPPTVPFSSSAGQDPPGEVEHARWPKYWRDEPAFRAAARALDRIERKFKLDFEDRQQLREALLTAAVEANNRAKATKTTLPNKAPELWAAREGRKENPIAFIRRVYAPWIRGGLTRAYLLEVDRPLYTALGVWLHRHPEARFPGDETLGERLAAPGKWGQRRLLK
jgi:hypothetical protein